MITRYDLVPCGCDKPDDHMERDPSGDYVLFQDHAHALAEEQARARQMEETIARVSALLERWVAQRLKETRGAPDYYGIEPEHRLQGAWWIRDLRAALSNLG